MSYQVHLMSSRLISVTQYSLRIVERPAKNWSFSSFCVAGTDQCFNPWSSLFPHPRLLRCERQFYIWYHADSWTFTKEVNVGPVNISGPLRKPNRTLAFCLHMKRCRSDVATRYDLYRIGVSVVTLRWFSQWPKNLSNMALVMPNLIEDSLTV